MHIEPAHEKINRLLKFLYYNSAGIDIWSDGFDYSDIFGDNLLDLLVNCDKIEDIDYSKFIVYLMLSKFCPYTDIPILSLTDFPKTLKHNYLENLTTILEYYKKYITMDVSVIDGNLEIHSYENVIVENSLIANIFLNIIIAQEHKYRPQAASANNFAYYLCLLF